MRSPTSASTTSRCRRAPSACGARSRTPAEGDSDRLGFVLGCAPAPGESHGRARPLHREKAMFDLERFIEDCRPAVGADPSHKAVREVLARANADPAAILKTLGEPTKAGVTPLHKSATLTVLNVVWGKRMTVLPHNHTM